MISQGRRYLLDYWWIPTTPGLVILFMALGMNLMGDAFRDLLDPSAPRPVDDERSNRPTSPTSERDPLMREADIKKSAVEHMWMHATQMRDGATDIGARIIVEGHGCRLTDIAGQSYIAGL